MGLPARLWKSEVAQWVGHALRRNNNPVFQFLQLVSKRRAASRRWYSKGAPLIIGAIPTLIMLGLIAYEYYIGGAPSGLEEAVKYAPLVFLVVSYISWAVMGLNLAIMDAMSLLRRATKQSSRFELDDLTCVTTITDREFVVGFLAHTLPRLYLRVVAGVGLGWLIILLISSEWFFSFGQDTWTLIALAPFSTGIWSASGCIGVTALLAFYLALGSGRSSIPASMASLAVLGSQGIWLIYGIALVESNSLNTIGYSDNPFESLFAFGSMFLMPVIFVALLAFGLRIVFSFPVLKPVQAIGSPLLFPVLVIIFVQLFLVASEYYYDFYYGDFPWAALVSSYVWHFGDMLPLNFGILSFPVFYNGDLLGAADELSYLWFRPITIALAQFALLFICLSYAKKAVGLRRQAS